MSNYIFSGFEFDELNSSYKLKNITPIHIGETGQMKLPLLNDQNNGYILNTTTVYNSNPDFSLEKQIDTNIVTLMKYDGTNDIFKFYKNIDLQNLGRVSSSLDPVFAKDLATKNYVDVAMADLRREILRRMAQKDRKEVRE